jgi:protein arginine N-methyltransferase 3
VLDDQRSAQENPTTQAPKMSGLAPGGDAYPSSSEGSENSDILDLKDDEGWEDAEPDVEETRFVSLTDGEIFPDIHSMLKHCKDKHNLDFLEVRQKLGLDFYGNIKLVNFIRSQVHAGKEIPSNITKDLFEDDQFLKPVLEDDALLFSLDDLPEVSENDQGLKEDSSGKEVASDSGLLVARVSELEEELRRIQLQFENYRATVSETLDDRWNDQVTSGPSKSTNEQKEEKRDDDSHYFTSYSYNGW